MRETTHMDAVAHSEASKPEEGNATIVLPSRRWWCHRQDANRLFWHKKIVTLQHYGQKARKKLLWLLAKGSHLQAQKSLSYFSIVQLFLNYLPEKNVNMFISLPSAIYLLLFMHFCLSQIKLSANFKGHARFYYKGNGVIHFPWLKASFLAPNHHPCYSCQVLQINPHLFESDSSQ